MTACMVDTESVSVMAATLANGGICPTTGERLRMTANDCLYGGHGVPVCDGGHPGQWRHLSHHRGKG
jgi:hypothetical protein